MKTSEIPIVFVSLVISSCVVLAIANGLHHHKDLPPGYTILCDHNGHYAFQGDGFIITTGEANYNPMTSRQEAIDHAWSWHKWFVKDIHPVCWDETNHVNWNQCDGMEKNK